VAGSEVAQLACLDVALERLDRAAELGRRLRHGERVIGPAHALLTRRPLDRPTFLDANRPVVGAELSGSSLMVRLAEFCCVGDRSSAPSDGVV